MVERSHGFFRSSLSVCKSRVESGVQCVTNGAENSTKKIAILTRNVSKIEQSFQISSVFKLNEEITLSLKFALLF